MQTEKLSNQESFSEDIDIAQEMNQAGEKVTFYDERVRTEAEAILKKIEHLRNSEDFKQEVIKTKTEYKQNLALLEDDDDVWELLTFLRIYQESVFIHGIKTYELAKSKFSLEIDNSAKIGDIIEQEMGGEKDFLIACLLHDIGKIRIPDEILTDTLNDHAWGSMLKSIVVKDRNKLTSLAAEYTNLDETEQKEMIEKLIKAKNIDEIVEVLDEYFLRPKDLVPYEMKFNDREREAKRKEFLNKYGVHIHEPLGKILSYHSKISSEIIKLMSKSDSDIARLVGNHHLKAEKVSETMLRMSAEQNAGMARALDTILLLSDFQEATSTSRSYRNAPLTTLVILEKFARMAGTLLRKEVVKAWVKSEIKKMFTESESKNSFFKSYDLKTWQLLGKQTEERGDKQKIKKFKSIEEHLSLNIAQILS